MTVEQPSSEWRALVGELKDPLRRLGKAEKQRLKRYLQEADLTSLDAAWIARLSVAVGVPVPTTAYNATVISRAFLAGDVARRIEKLCVVDRIIEGRAPLQAMVQQLDKGNAGLVLSALTRLTSQKKKGTPSKLVPETITEVLQAAMRVAELAVAGPLEGSSPKNTQTTRRLINLALGVAAQSDAPPVCSLALQLVSFLKRRIGSPDFDRALGKNRAKWSYLASSPARLITGVLEQGCLNDAELLASCAMSIEESRASLEAALREGLATKGADLPLGSRLWAERLLGHRVPAEIQDRKVETASDVNLDRMATMLLAAWDAKDEGRKSQHMFQVLSGICRAGFKLSLAGLPGETAPFNPAIHQSIAPSIRAGVTVRIARPRVQWSDGPITRIIIRALVAPLEQAGDGAPA